MATAKKSDTPDYVTLAEKIVKAMPKPVRDKTVVEEGGGKYALVKHDGKTVASVRSKNVRVTQYHDGSAGAVTALAGLLTDAAKSRPVVEAKPKGKAEGDDGGSE